MPGQLIVFEGPDGVGKTTLSRALAEHQAGSGRRVAWMSFPGREAGTLGCLVYEVHHEAERHGVGGLGPAALQALHVAAHLDAIERRVVPRLQAGEDVVLDRYWWSTWAYGVVDGVEPALLAALLEAERVAWGGVEPAPLVLVRTERPREREGEDPVRWRQLRDAYDALAERESARVPIVTYANDGPREQALERLLALLSLP